MILVVGGTGFIGKTLLLRLRDAGVEAMTVSRDPDRRFLSEYLPQTRAVALDAFLDAPDEILGQIKGCVYLASAGRLGDNRQAPWVEAQQALAPLMRMLHLVGAPARGGPVPFVFLSSAAIYGSRDDLLLDETMRPLPRTPYGTGKAMAETAVEAAGRQYGFSTRILRPSTPIGRLQDGTAPGAVGALMNAAASGATFFINGDGSAVRDYFDVRDLADAIIAALGAPRIQHGLWNVGSGQGVSLTQMIDRIRDATGRSVAVQHRPMPEGEVARAVLDVTRIRAELGWAPTTPLCQSLTNIWASRSAG